MDPDAALAILRAYTEEEPADPIQALEEVTDTVRGLDEWLTSGGFLPKEWRPRHDTPEAHEAAAMWGSAENHAYTAEQRLACALKALAYFGKDAL